MNKILITAIAVLLCVSFPLHAQESKPLSIAMTTWVGYGLLHLANEKGFFKEHNVNVSLKTIPDKPATAAAIATDRLDGWATTVDTFIFYNAKKLGLQQVLAVDFSNGGEGIVAKRDIHTVSDLKGRTIAAEEGSSTYFFLMNLLSYHNMTINDVKLQSMRAGDAGAAFVAGRVDAAATWDPWLSKAEESGGHILKSSADIPGLIVDTVAFRSEVIENRPTDVANFIKAYFEAYDYWKSSPTDANAIMAKALGIKEQDFRDSLSGIKFVSRKENEKYIGTPTSVGQIEEVTERGITFYKQAGLIKKIFDAKSVVDAEPLADALAE